MRADDSDTALNLALVLPVLACNHCIDLIDSHFRYALSAATICLFGASSSSLH
ncbi:hypothetical protein OMCYN_01408 [cyanobiont of Ornithocercus magnificus]|nr:hypothetical protein OMCYN_01408 [cyanobiont of Ornithocercus magnificus]